MNKILELPCAVTMYDLKVVLLRDGRNRGLWIGLTDTERNPPLDAMALLEWPAVRKLLKAAGRTPKKEG